MGGNIAEAEQMIAHEHGDGEMYVAESLEKAREMCPMLGKLSIEEAGLLLELESIGKKLQNQTEQRPKVGKIEKIVVEKPQKIERIEKITPAPEIDSFVIEPEEKPIFNEVLVAEPVVTAEELHIQDILQQQEAVHSEVEQIEDTAQFYQLEIADLPQPIQTVIQETATIEPTPTEPLEVLTETRYKIVDTEPILAEKDIEEVAEIVVSEPEAFDVDQTLLFTDELPAPILDTETTDFTPEEIEIEETTNVPNFTESEPVLTVEEEVFQDEVIQAFTETLATLEPEESEVIHELLDAVVEQIQQIKETPVEITETDETELVEQFIEIFEQLDLDYTHEEIVNFVHLLLKSEAIELEPDNPVLVNNALSDLGTHEGLTYLLSTKRPLKKLINSLHTVLGRLVLLTPKLNVN